MSESKVWIIHSQIKLKFRSTKSSFRIKKKPTERRVLREALHTHGLPGDHINNGGISRLQGLGVVLELLTRATVNLFLQLSKLARNVCSVAVQHGGISSTDLTRVVQDNHLQGSRHRYYL